MLNNLFAIVLFVGVGFLSWARITGRTSANWLQPVADICTIAGFIVAVYVLVSAPTTGTGPTLDVTAIPSIQSETPNFGSSPVVTETFTDTAVTPAESLPPGPEGASLFLDNFDGPEISSSWSIFSAGLTIKEQALYANYTNSSTQFTGQAIDKVPGGAQFHRAEFTARVVNGASSGQLRFETSCADLNSRLNLNIFDDDGIQGTYTTDGQEIPLPWGIIRAPDKVYNVQLIQEDDVVIAFVNGYRLAAPYPCISMGQKLRLAAAAGPDGHIEGYFDYIKLYSE